MMTNFLKPFIILLSLTGTAWEGPEPSHEYSLLEAIEVIAPEKSLLLHRIQSNQKKIDPVHLYCRNLSLSCPALIEKISKNHQKLKKQITLTEDPRRPHIYRFDLTEKMLPNLNLQEVQNLLRTTHHNIALDGQTLYESDKEAKYLMSEISHFLTQSDLQKIEDKIQQAEDIVVETDLLPKDLRAKVKNYTSYLGPNCFEAALSFQDPKFSRSYKFNIRNEEGHHKIMINNDELFTALERHFYELNLSKSKLRFGDLIIFVDGSQAKSEKDMKYSWIKHAFVFLFNDYTFSKGSKSSNSPYTIKTLAEEWSTWKRLYKHLKIKVFRKPIQRNSTFDRKKLVDWRH